MAEQSAEPLDVAGKTASGAIGVVMKYVTTETKDSRQFRYRAGFFSVIQTIEWVNDSMFAVIPAADAQRLLDKNHARLMTPAEIEDYNAQIEKEKQP